MLIFKKGKLIGPTWAWAVIGHCIMHVTQWAHSEGRDFNLKSSALSVSIRDKLYGYPSVDTVGLIITQEDGE